MINKKVSITEPNGTVTYGKISAVTDKYVSIITPSGEIKVIEKINLVIKILSLAEIIINWFKRVILNKK